MRSTFPTPLLALVLVASAACSAEVAPLADAGFASADAGVRDSGPRDAGFVLEKFCRESFEIEQERLAECLGGEASEYARVYAESDLMWRCAIRPQPAFDEGRTGFSDYSIPFCHRWLRESSCDAFHRWFVDHRLLGGPTIPACNDVARGRRFLGDECFLGDFECYGAFYCKARGATCPYQCVPRAYLRQDCRTAPCSHHFGLYCGPDQLCLEIPKIGEPCFDRCELGAHCRAGVCAPLRQAGEECEAGGPELDALSCGTLRTCDDVCRPLPTLHEPCGGALGTCPFPLVCAGECILPASPGEPCAVDADSYTAPGLVTGTCAGMFRCEWDGLTRTGTCAAVKNWGEACAEDGECQVSCRGGTCEGGRLQCL